MRCMIIKHWDSEGRFSRNEWHRLVPDTHRSKHKCVRPISPPPPQQIQDAATKRFAWAGQHRSWLRRCTYWRNSTGVRKGYWETYLGGLTRGGRPTLLWLVATLPQNKSARQHEFRWMSIGITAASKYSLHTSSLWPTIADEI